MPVDPSRPWLAHYEDGVNAEIPAFGKPLFHFLDEAARRNPDRAALRFQNTLLTYRQLKRQAERMAGRLRELGVGD